MHVNLFAQGFERRGFYHFVNSEHSSRQHGYYKVARHAANTPR
jgi:hypothetical protein